MDKSYADGIEYGLRVGVELAVGCLVLIGSGVLIGWMRWGRSSRGKQHEQHGRDEQ